MKRTFLLIAFLAGITLPSQGQISLNLLGTYHTGKFDDGGTEIVAYVESSQRLFSVNAADGTVDMIDMSSPNNPVLISQIDLTNYGGPANSVASYGSYVAAAIEASTAQNNGLVVFFDSVGNYVSQVTVGPLPDMVIFTPNGNYVLTANEGEPNDDYTVDPEGSISIIDISGGISNLQQSDVSTATFNSFNGQSLDPSIRIFGDDGNATVAEDLEPEYITISSDGSTAYVACQENNALAIVDIANANVTALLGLGFKDHNLAGNGMDASNEANAIDITTWPVYGMYQPDAIDLYNVNGQDYILSANEGDSRDYDGYSEEERVKDLVLDAVAFPNASFLQNDTNLGRLKISLANGDTDNDGEYEEIYVYGGRSFAIWNATTGALVWDSGDDIEQMIANLDPANFNSTNDDNTSYKSRSDDKGPEPEALTYANIGGHHFAFIGLERQGGIMAYEISDPANPIFIEYVTNRNFAVPADSSAAGDLAPEGLTYIPASASPNGEHLLVSANEVSGTISIWKIEVLFTNIV